MANYGRSAGCITCKERRVKCDQAKPNCRECRRLALECKGYKSRYAKLKFIDQSHTLRSKLNPPNQNDRHSTKRLELRQMSIPDTAVPFFLNYYARLGRNMGSARGFFEVLIPAYSSQPQASTLCLAVSAVASGIQSIWRREPFESTRAGYTQAINSLRNTVQHFNGRATPETVLATLCLHLYENVAAIYSVRRAIPIHQDGALSLVQYMDSGNNNHTFMAYIRRFILHTEISSAIRLGRSLRNIALSSITREELLAAPNNPSCQLDSIGISLAELQAYYSNIENQTDTIGWPRTVLRDVKAKAECIDERLQAWARDQPAHWRSQYSITGKQLDPSVIKYQSVCEVYPSCQVATIWNSWRIQRLLVLKILINPAIQEMYLGEIPNTHLKNGVSFASQQAIQDLVDSVCYSIPFCLGNRLHRLSMADFDDPTILFPTNNSLGHIIAQGPWHLMSPLSRLVTLFAEGEGQIMEGLLRPGQYQWICEQFLRLVEILGIPSADCGDRIVDDMRPDISSPGQRSIRIRAAFLARRVRSGTAFMSGP